MSCSQEPLILNVTYFLQFDSFFQMWPMFYSLTHFSKCDPFFFFTVWPIFHSVTSFLQSYPSFVMNPLLHSVTILKMWLFTVWPIFLNSTLFLQFHYFFIQMLPIFHSATHFYSVTHFSQCNQSLQCDPVFEMYSWFPCDVRNLNVYFFAGCPIFLIVTYTFFTVSLIFPSVTHVLQSDPFFYGVIHFSQCDQFFTELPIFRNESLTSLCHNFKNVTFFTVWPI